MMHKLAKCYTSSYLLFYTRLQLIWKYLYLKNVNILAHKNKCKKKKKVK